MSTKIPPLSVTEQIDDLRRDFDCAMKLRADGVRLRHAKRRDEREMLAGIAHGRMPDWGLTDRYTRTLEDLRSNHADRAMLRTSTARRLRALGWSVLMNQPPK